MNYEANDIETLNFKQAIRKRIEMYMGSADNQGVIQCVRETISNSIDEFSIGFGKEVHITVKDNVWIGGNCVLLPGVTIGENTVIGAGSVVTKDIPANVVAVGNPCKPIKQLVE